MNNVVGLIDYGMGNLHSVRQSFKRLNHPLKVIEKPKDLKNCDALILPGVGAFDPAIRNLEKTELIPNIKHWVIEGRPLLGICLGLQLLFDSSDEGKLKGLGLLKGNVSKLASNQKERVPHMGWALVNQVNECPLLKEGDISNWMYFVHSYSAIPQSEDLAATVEFGHTSITAMVWKDNFGACQFHPEKSGKAGERLLSRWITWLKETHKKSY